MLLHISSLPSCYGVGDFGEGAFAFLDFLDRAGIAAWQVLPLAPTVAANAYSPYSSPSAFAGNPLFVAPDRLAQLGLLDEAALRRCALVPADAADYAAAEAIKGDLLRDAYDRFRDDGADMRAFRRISDAFLDFCGEEAHWLEDYALFSVLKRMEDGAPWWEWRPAWRDRDWSALDPLKARPDVARALDFQRFVQFLFHLQLRELREACERRGIELIGDMPIYVADDSADVWGYRRFFELGETGRPTSVAGVPPDYFSEEGQHWGNPLYRWDEMRQDGYGWWMRRIRHVLRGVHRLRIDHFRGLVEYWAIPAGEETAVRGAWREGPGGDFLRVLEENFYPGGACPPFITEDLGVASDSVTDAMERFRLPSMKVLQFAFGEGMPDNPYIPHRHRRNCVVYAGTHDNNTIAGWWDEDATPLERDNFLAYAGLPCADAADAADAMLRMAIFSTADLAVFAAQDILRLGGEARTNTPSTVEGNWLWRLSGLEALNRRAEEVRRLIHLGGRLPRLEHGYRVEAGRFDLDLAAPGG